MDFGSPHVDTLNLHDFLLMRLINAVFYRSSVTIWGLELLDIFHCNGLLMLDLQRPIGFLGHSGQLSKGVAEKWKTSL